MTRAQLFLPIVVVALSGCAALDLSPKSLTGQWGGPHVSLLVEGGLVSEIGTSPKDPKRRYFRAR